MAYEELANRNTTEGLHVLLQYVVDIVPFFIPMLLFTFFIILFLGGIFFQRRATGDSDVPVSFAVAGFVTAILAVLMNLLEGVINIETMSVTIAVAAIGIGWLYLSNKT